MDLPLRILHLEDDPLDSKRVLSLLHDDGLPAEIDRVATMGDFVARLDCSRYDLILSDFTLPGMDAHEVFVLARRTCSHLPIIFLADTLGEDTAIEMLKQGASDYVLKQRIGRLVPAVRRALKEAEEQTRRRQVEAALREKEQRLRAMFDKAAVGIIEVEGDDHHCVAINDRACEILGYRRDELLGTTVHELTYPEDRPLSDDLNAQLHEGLRDTISYEKRYLRRDGTPLWVHVAVSAVRDAQGRFLRSIGTVEDISERKRAEEALRQSEQRFRILADAIPHLAWIAKADGWIYWYNQRWYEYTGTTPEQMEGWGWQSVHDPQSLPAVLERWKGSIKTGEPFDMIIPIRGADGVFRPFLTRGMPLKDEQGQVLQWFGTNTDVSEQKATEEELAAAKTSAEHAKATAERANRTKDHFLAVLSHELRTPLTPVVMAVSMLQDRKDLDPSVQDSLEMIRRNVEMEARLIDDLLDLTRIARGKVELQRQRVELCTVIERAVEVCRPDIEARGLEFAVDIGPDAPYWVEADIARLQQVFWNLLKNAVKFTPKGGCVGVRCLRDGQEHVLVEVNDSGIGITPEALPRVFNAFEQTERSITRQFGGLGLGLAISKALVEMHGGQLKAHSEGRDQGASFHVRLPLVSPAVRVEAPAAAPSKGTCHRLRILLVEDHGVTAKMMRMVLAAEGHEVQTASDVATALQAVEQHRFDLLVSDLGLPDGSGHDLMEKLRLRGHHFPGIALSGYGQESDIQRSHEAGFAAHLTKPASRERLLESIAAVASGGHQH